MVILDPVCRNVFPDCLVNLKTLNLHQVIVEGSEGLPGRADGHIGERDLSDGEDLHRGGDGALLPPSEGLEDQERRAAEAGQHHRQPEELEKLPGGWDVGQAVDGGGAEEHVDLLQHPPTSNNFQTVRAGLAYLSIYLLLSL